MAGQGFQAREPLRLPAVGYIRVGGQVVCDGDGALFDRSSQVRASSTNKVCETKCMEIIQLHTSSKL